MLPSLVFTLMRHGGGGGEKLIKLKFGWRIDFFRSAFNILFFFLSLLGAPMNSSPKTLNSFWL